ncbi:hypothetical protein HanRHA438_Chr14g0636911 [Helianthus annuus]|uniref:Uncharacterized protein n=1 Tax=Helianthus annuus TaxID=4232 RepID=A0A251SF51_HELAN|nr:uncharacterized protein LOC110908367 [Helianthus annuus]XP_022008995.1 uncharacterized protein LOC110908367 [Helianthus annuus]KAF5767675.1 hypothetical protein HanXRQr2_Chr14g0627161 [Helianthus annuus]KAJ0463167.1 hypothetical protein HanHA300_Chr14g0512171 [Helianthus annuus]KAJ0467031.1 hypothetical protein HanIR_Chr14g0678721 [Helianthus annuus]KAJ0484539.1 hypothetical protein HanHA89_Chr14g0545241 [Helianthus annuus]KAJ0655094.1 hypothetical protein HanLR1_Chr14g0514531 [Helianthus 
MVGEKRARDDDDTALKFTPGLTLSQHPPALRKDLFLKKLKSIIIGKSLHPTEFEGYTIRERFERMGWEQLLNLSCDRIYERVVIQWVSSLSRSGDDLTGIVDGKSYTITPVIIRDVLGVDTRKDFPYARFKEADFQTTSDENKRRCAEACKTVFGVEESRVCEKSNMTPLVQILWQIGVCTFHPPHEEASGSEIYLLHRRLLI